MPLPLSQEVPFLYSGSVTASNTTQLITAITGMMRQVGWTTTGAGVLRCNTDEQGRFFEMEVVQNENPALSHQIQFAVYKRTKAEDFTAYINRGFQISTGQTYKIHANPFGIYCERNVAGTNNSQQAWAFQLYANPVGSGIQSAAILAGGHRDYAGSAASTTYITSAASAYYGASSGGAGSSNDFMGDNLSVAQWAYFRGGRIFIQEDWIRGHGSEGIIGRPYHVLIGGTQGGAGFDLPSGTGTISYVKMDGFQTNGNFGYCIRAA